MAQIIVAGDAESGDVALGKTFCAGINYNAVGTLVLGEGITGSGVNLILSVPTMLSIPTVIAITNININLTLSAPTIPTLNVIAELL